MKKIIDSIEGRMVIKYYPTRAATVNTLSAHLKQLELKNIKPDLVIVDYADILRDNSGMRETCISLGVQCTQYAQDSTQDSRFLHGFHSVRGILVCVGSR